MDDLTIIILTYNETKRIQLLLNSLQSVTKKIFVVDSYSTDTTIDILIENEIVYTQHPFINYSEQRNWAQNNNPFQTTWVMHLDADEPISPALANWLKNDFSTLKKSYDGFLFSRKTFFLGKWIKHGGQYPNFHLRLYKLSLGKCENKAYDQHFVLQSNKIKIVKKTDIYNTVAENIDDLIISHNKWATLEAKEIVTSNKMVGDVKASLLGTPIERKRWLKVNLFQKMPLFVRSFLYFFYRYILRCGFLDGKEGLIFYILQTFWFRFLIDAKVFELEKKSTKTVCKDNQL